jgi:hypothetical protein
MLSINHTKCRITGSKLLEIRVGRYRMAVLRWSPTTLIYLGLFAVANMSKD